MIFCRHKFGPGQNHNLKFGPGPGQVEKHLALGVAGLFGH
jgi:hypothetical protein